MVDNNVQIINTNQNPQVVNAPPAVQLNSNRSLIITILLSLVTLGIYTIIFYCFISNDINTIASKYDGKKTMFFLFVALLNIVTCGIASIVWLHILSNRIGGELSRRGINYSFDAATFWLWGVLGSIIVIGPFVYLHKMCESMNMLATHYNING